MNLLYTFVLAEIVTALGLSLARLVRGPSLADRVVASDLMGTLVLGVVVVVSVKSGQAPFLDAGLVLALLSFVGTATYAYYLGLRGKK